MSRVIAAWSALRSCAVSPAWGCETITAGRAEVDLERQEQTEQFLAARQARRGGRRRRQGRRHSRQRCLSGRVHLRESRHRPQPHSRQPPGRREEAPVPRLVVHLSATWPRSRCARRNCSPGRSSRPTNGTRSPRSRASSCAKPIAASTAPISSRSMPTNLYGPGDNYHPEDSHVRAGIDPALPPGQAGWRADGERVGHRHAVSRVPVRG